MDKAAPSFTVGGDVNWWSHYGKQYGGSSKEAKNRVSVWFSSPTPGHISRWNDRKITRTPVLTAALYTRVKTWKQPKCPSTNEKDVVHICNGTLLSQEWNHAICSNMDGPRDYQTKWSQTKTNIIRCHLYVEPKIGHNWTYLWNRPTDIENRLGLPRWRWVGEGGWSGS